MTKERQPIDDKLRASLNALRERTGVTPRQLLKGRSDIPQRLSAYVVINWLSGAVDHAEPAHLEYVTQRKRPPRLERLSSSSTF